MAVTPVRPRCVGQSWGLPAGMWVGPRRLKLVPAVVSCCDHVSQSLGSACSPVTSLDRSWRARSPPSWTQLPHRTLPPCCFQPAFGPGPSHSRPVSYWASVSGPQPQGKSEQGCPLTGPPAVKGAVFQVYATLPFYGTLLLKLGASDSSTSKAVPCPPARTAEPPRPSGFTAVTPKPHSVVSAAPLQ